MDKLNKSLLGALATAANILERDGTPSRVELANDLRTLERQLAPNAYVMTKEDYEACEGCALTERSITAENLTDLPEDFSEEELKDFVEWYNQLGTIFNLEMWRNPNE